MRRLLLAAAVLTGTALWSKEIYVDYQSGKAGNPGTREAPYSAVAQALKNVSPGDTIYILPCDQPIRDNIQITDICGTAEAPVTIDGMNNIFLGTNPLNPEVWKEISPGVYKREMKTGRNWARRFFMTFGGHINRM